MADYQIELVEQPVKRRDLEGLKYVTSQVNTTIMADESCFDAQDALELVKKGTVDDLDATFGLGTAPVTGGVSLEAKPLLELGEAAGLGISH